MDEERNKAAEEYAKGYFDVCSAAKRAADHGFIAGAKWDREQMLKKAVEVRVQTSPLNGPLGISAYCCNFPSKHPFYHCKEGDKVRIIIVKEDEK